MINLEELPDLLTLADIRDLTGYKSTISAYQMLRLKGVQPVSYRPTPGKGPAVNEYTREDVLGVFRDRIRRHQRSLDDHA